MERKKKNKNHKIKTLSVSWRAAEGNWKFHTNLENLPYTQCCAQAGRQHSNSSASFSEFFYFQFNFLLTEFNSFWAIRAFTLNNTWNFEMFRTTPSWLWIGKVNRKTMRGNCIAYRENVQVKHQKLKILKSIKKKIRRWCGWFWLCLRFTLTESWIQLNCSVFIPYCWFYPIFIKILKVEVNVKR